MNARAVVFGSWLLLGFGSFVLVPACGGTDATDDDNGDDDDNDESSSSSSGSSSGKLGSSSGGKSSSGGSSSSGSSSGADSDASDDDAGGEEPIDPDPGDACVTVGHAFSKNCGECGTQFAYCAQNHQVGGYGACKEGTRVCGEADSGPGPIDSGPGPVDSGPGPIDSGPGIPDAGPTGTIATLVLGTSVGASTTVFLPDNQGRTTKPLNSGGDTFTCPLTLSDETSVYAYVLVQNPNATAAKIDLTVVGGGDSYLVVYPTVPATPAARENCSGFFDNGCGSYIGPGCLLGTDGPTVPAGGSVVAYIARFAVNSVWEDPTLKAVVKSLP